MELITITIIEHAGQVSSPLILVIRGSLATAQLLYVNITVEAQLSPGTAWTNVDMFTAAPQLKRNEIR